MATTATPMENSTTRTKHLAAIAIALAFTVAFYRTAWVAEDAFITFRVIDNALNGLGLVWNPGERVQAFTHPLWLGLLLPLVGILGDPYYSALLLAYALLLITLVIIWHTLDHRYWPALVAILSLLWSQAFIDYSSSGLENPLTHALTAGFVWAWLKKRHTLLLTLIASGLFLSRPDAIVLIAPALTYQLWRTRKWRTVALGAIPVAVWIIFSLFYYGAPVPNTALAKVGTSLSIADKARQAINYIEWTWDNDAVTLAIITIGAICGVLETRCRVFVAGLLLFFAYLFYVGADYMGGRFFSTPALLAALIIAVYASEKVAIALAAILVAGIGSLNASVLAQASFSSGDIVNSIANERGYYYQQLGLSPVLRAGSWRTHLWFFMGRVPPGLYTRCTIGMAGYSGGPLVRWIDPLALTEPFLARLPSRTNARTGHYERALPAGYLESVISGQNLISNSALHELYSDVILATTAPLLSFERAGAIWRLNTGFHRDAASTFDRDAIGLPGVAVETKSSLSCYGIPYGKDQEWKIEGAPPTATPVRARLADPGQPLPKTD